MSIVMLLPVGITATFVYFAVIDSEVLMIFIISSAILDLYSIFSIVSYGRRNENATVFWLIFVILLPMYGSIFYIVNGSHYMLYDQKILSKREDKKKELNLEDKPYEIRPSMIKSHKTYTDAFEKYNDLFIDLNKAKKSIYIQYFIIRDDYLFYQLMRILDRKSKEGVEVYVMTDFMGSWTFDLTKFYKLRQGKIKTKIYNPFTGLVSHGAMNHRNHRKAVVIDESITYIGGMNFAMYYGGISKDFGIWKDLHFRFTGKDFSTQIAKTFSLDWNHESKEDTPLEISIKETNEKDSNISIFDDGLDASSTTYLNYLIDTIDKAKERVWFAMPYPILPWKLEKSIISAKQRGVDVKVIAPGSPDKISAYFVSYAYIKKMVKHDVDARRYNSAFMHTKMVIIDDEVIAGTSNTDFRSIYQHYETNLIVTDKKFVDEMVGIYNEYLDDSRKMKYIFRHIPIFDTVLYFVLKIPSPVL